MDFIGIDLHKVSSQVCILTGIRRLARDYERLPETVAGLHFPVEEMQVLALPRAVYIYD
jgi:hypothetical protein